MTSQPGRQTIAIHILPNISRNKGNIIWEIFFLKNSTQNVVEKIFPDFFLKSQN